MRLTRRSSGCPTLRAFLRNVLRTFYCARRHSVPATTEFEQEFQHANPNYSHHQNFYAVQMSFRGKNAKIVRSLVGYMDDIDSIRNNLKAQKIGGASDVAPLLK